MEAIVIFFIAHWVLSVFSQSFFLHRYAAHRMFTLTPFWEKFFFLFTFITQGASFLNPRAYAIMHRLHHNHSDTEYDPHSPVYSPNVGAMMHKTAIIYDAYSRKLTEAPREALHTPLPEWPWLEHVSNSWVVRISMGSLFAFYYMAFVPEGQWGWYLLLPVHWLMGPIHGAIVNWCGHKYGYVNHSKTKDQSKNTLPVDVLIGGELYQNNHHAHPNSPDFAWKWYELDLTYQVMRLLAALKIIRFLRDAHKENGKKILANGRILA